MRRSFNRSLVAIVGEGLLSRLSFGLISFSLPLYARHLGFSLQEVGILTALNSAVAVGAKPLMGRFADRYGLKRAYTLSIGLRSIVSLLLGLAAAPWQLFAIRSLHGLSIALRDPSANALIAENGADDSVASAFAWYETAKSVAASLSKAAAGILLTITARSYSLVFFMAFALSLLPIFVVKRYVKGDSTEGIIHEPELPPAPSDENTTGGNAAAQSQGKPPILPFALLGFLIAGTAEMLTGLFPIIATEYAGLTDAQAGIVFTIATLVIIPSGPLFGWLSDNVSRKLVLTIRGAANTLSSILYVVAPTFAGIAVARTVDDMGKAAFRPAWGALMTSVSSFDRRNRARTMSWLSMGEDAGTTLAPVLAGFLWNAWGITALMSVRVLLALGTEVYAILIAHGPKKNASPTRRRAGPADWPLKTAPRAVLDPKLGSEEIGGGL